MPFSSLSPAEAAALLSQIGLAANADNIQIQLREERWLVNVPSERMAWFAATNVGREILIRDRKILQLIEERCAFQVPRVLAEHPSGDFDVRAMVKGASDPVILFNAVRGDAEIAKRVGTRVGEMLAELHTKIQRTDVEDIVQHKPYWPEDMQWILQRLPDVTTDPDLIARARDALSRYTQVKVAEHDRVLTHGDLGMHALAYGPHSFDINGLFDFDGSCYADRHHDFRYLIFGDHSVVLDSALSRYQSITGQRLNRKRIYLYNAACALSYLAFRSSHPAAEPWCGRTLQEDLQWTDEALAAID